MAINIPTTYTRTVIGYQLTNIEYKILTDFNESSNAGRYIIAIKYGTKWIITKDVVDGVLADPYWKKWHPLIQSRIDKKTVATYTITIDTVG